MGDLDAETDRELLKDCFIDNGELSLLMNVKAPESIVVGRTGAGKSAMLIQIEEKAEHHKMLDPNNISIRFLEYSDIIQFFDSIGVNLDLFYKLLWRHIITVEFLKMRYSLSSEKDSQGLLSRLQEFVDRDPVKKEALTYFKEWGEKFWLDTEEQLIEVVKKMSDELKSSVSSELIGVSLNLDGAKSLSEERKTEIVSKANRVVNQLQIRKLAKILDLLEEKVFVDEQKKYFLLIDRLDENWADTNTRYRFIKALIEEIKTFRKINNIKIIIALRKDLLDIVFDKTRDSGFQEDKNESYFLPLIWTRRDLFNLIQKRVSVVYKRQYTKKDVRFDDIFPSPRKGGGITAINYLLDRTLCRPRDALQFANECFIAALGSPRISWKAISQAESNYSNKRLRSLFEEWGSIFPGLTETVEVLRGKPAVFTRNAIAESLNDVVSKLIDYPNDPCGKAVIDYCKSNNSTDTDVTFSIISCLYRVGAIGVKVSTKEPFKWADYSQSILSKSQILRINQIKIHKMLRKTLGVREKDLFDKLLEAK
ncbi:P-loop ATPase, Sll1717 family [Aliikangiella sp. G2MR2-5]|uniref:P-loop ATPase, Sll1717 family n=1 Tax=Aliikangiella sp. G2MR2-5 TaxID=2788943 RepID=UPI001AED2C64|nr:hypothetical protein [Aliikangiella sp. G2MR2-5]